MGPQSIFNTLKALCDERNLRCYNKANTTHAGPLLQINAFSKMYRIPGVHSDSLAEPLDKEHLKQLLDWSLRVHADNNNPNLK